MSALRSLRTALGSLTSDPVLFLVGLAYAVVVLPQSVLPLAGMQLTGTALQMLTFFVTPFLIAGIIGMAAESTGGGTSLSTLTRVGKDRYVPLLVAKFVQLGIYVAYAIAGGIVALIVAAVGLVVHIPLLVALAVALFLLGFAVIAFFIQFFTVAVSVGDADAIDSFRASLRLVRGNLLSTLGYSVLSFLVSAVVFLVTAGPIYYQQFQSLSQLQEMQQGGAGIGAGGMPAGMEMFQFSTQEILLVSIISLATTMLVFAFRQTYATAFYRDHAPRSEPEAERPTTGGTGASATGPGVDGAGADSVGTASDSGADDATGWDTDTDADTGDDGGWGTDDADDGPADGGSDDADRSREDRF